MRRSRAFLAFILISLFIPLASRANREGATAPGSPGDGVPANRDASADGIIAACLVFEAPEGGPPKVIGHDAVYLESGQTEIIYNEGPLEYSVKYQVVVFPDRTAFGYIRLFIKDASRGISMSAEAEAGSNWRQRLALQPPFNLPVFSCNPPHSPEAP
jgi:hypothetical protein